MTEIATINVHQLKQLMDENPKLCLIDVRELPEWQTVRIPGAKHIPKDRLTTEIESIAADRKQAIYLHCKGGVRSLYAAKTLLDLGYKEVYSVDGGILEWAMSGYLVEE
ncbi:rhodanese-like domain-containing protein [Legionella jordanis]|uniref:Rhodanese domain-containing protein n=1 Tax=Legionella jordanis TaxID=456 RepID=A0A0W0V975_9GAMM|nr:rhodanese-like domain-containing protein [Legionella jordanis]KTD16699.1 Rhodanese domain-containing protein [Legionella jordanis]RMX03770.1 rhodanese-like domain-containing protein [Legionella jordanis]RMX22169.1 rhodanese-like domain-containing protein [Legionella jordanis]VEH11833.1 rhodanese domain-containing protein [Legionella jordanis]